VALYRKKLLKSPVGCGNMFVDQARGDFFISIVIPSPSGEEALTGSLCVLGRS